MPCDRKRHAAVLTTLALLCSLALGCDLLGDQTEEANKIVHELNALKEKAVGIDKQADAKEQEMGGLEAVKDRARVNELSREQAELYRQSASLYREAADKAEQATKLKIDEWFREYLSLKSQELRKVGEITDVQRRQSEVWLGGQPFEAVKAEMDRLNEEGKKLSEELTNLNKRVEKAEEENKARIKK